MSITSWSMNCSRSVGFFLVVCSNVDNFSSVLSRFIRGHDSFFPPRFPHHITPLHYGGLRQWMLGHEDMIEVDFLFSGEGRMPGGNKRWQSLFPALKGVLFSDAYFMLFQKK